MAKPKPKDRRNADDLTPEELQRLGAGPLASPAISRRAASPGPACRISSSASLPASTSAKQPPTVSALLMSKEARDAFLLIDL